MKIKRDQIISLTDANRDFSRVARLADEHKAVVILEDNMPRYVVLSIEQVTGLHRADDEELDAVADRILKENLNAFERMTES